MKKNLFIFMVAVLLMPSWAAAQVQATPPFTVLRNNTNIDTNYLFVEIMYERTPCDEHIAEFGLQDLRNNQLDTTWTLRIDSILNNEGTYEINEDSTLLMRPKAGGYKLRFLRTTFPDNASTSDSVLICVKSSRVPFLCKGCAAAHSDALFASEKDIADNCPYVDAKNSDLVACYQRTSKAANWEAWIRDERDCKPYRIVQMPDNKWWLAQNLAYTKGLTDAVTADNSAVTPVADGYYWCPGAAIFDSIAAGRPGRLAGSTSNITKKSGGDTACHTYGVLYSLVSAVREDGIFAVPTKAALDTDSAPSTIRGICPKGWIFPGPYDWGMMFNYVAGCSAGDITAETGYCNQHRMMTGTSANSAVKFSPTVFAQLKATYSAPRKVGMGGLNDSIYATKTNPAWSRSVKDANIPEYTKHFGGEPQDKFGFSLLPIGFKYISDFRHLGQISDVWFAHYAGTANITTNVPTMLALRFRYDMNIALTSSTQLTGFPVRCMRNSQ